MSWAHGSSADTDPFYRRDKQVGVQPSVAGLFSLGGVYPGQRPGLFSDRLFQARLPDELVALYQGTTLVVP